MKPVAASVARALVAAALLLASVVGPSSPPSTTLAMFDDTEAALASFTADVPISTGCVVWANGTTTHPTLKVTGSDNRFDGCLHTNEDADLRGSGNTYNRTVRYVDELATGGQDNTYASGTVQVEAATLPVTFRLADYAPDGSAAAAAAADDAYHEHPSGATLDLAALAEGLHYVTGSATITAASGARRVTIVATGPIDVKGDDLALTPYTDGLLLYSDRTGDKAIQVSGSRDELEGAIYAPVGEVQFVSGSRDVRVEGQVLAETVLVGASRMTLVAQSPSTFVE